MLAKCDGKRKINENDYRVSMSSNSSSNNSNSGIYRQSSDECDEESRDERDDVDVLRVKAEGWSVLADSQVNRKIKHYPTPPSIPH